MISIEEKIFGWHISAKCRAVKKDFLLQSNFLELKDCIRFRIISELNKKYNKQIFLVSVITTFGQKSALLFKRVKYSRWRIKENEYSVVNLWRHIYDFNPSRTNPVSDDLRNMITPTHIPYFISFTWQKLSTDNKINTSLKQGSKIPHGDSSTKVSCSVRMWHHGDLVPWKITDSVLDWESRKKEIPLDKQKMNWNKLFKKKLIVVLVSSTNHHWCSLKN